MCGIAGFYGFKNNNLIGNMSRNLAHRGPDGEGVYTDDVVTLLNRRLAIIDRKGGSQPIYNEDKTLVIVYNGEIYNFDELREELVAQGHRFKTKSDTEVIVHGYEEWGTKAFDRFNGMFAFALYDIKKKKLILARDHFGIKPLYYSLIETESDSVKKVIFSSEIKPMIYSSLVGKKPNDRVIYRYLKYRVHDDTRETFFDGVYRLMPGEFLELAGEKFEVKKYTSLEEELLNIRVNKQLNESHVDRFRSELRKAIRYRLISEVPVGSCLSGGLDSSTVVSVVNELLKEKVEEAESVGKTQNTFSAIFPHKSNDEEKYIDQLVESLKSKVQAHKVSPTPEEFFQDLRDFVKAQEEPTISTGPYAQYKVMQLAHKKVTVVLDGQGADEMMAGYLPYYFVYLRQLFKERKYLYFLKELVLSSDVVSALLINRLYGLLGMRKAIAADELMGQKFKTKFSKERFSPTQNDIKKRLVEDIFHNSLQALLRYEDKNAMKFSIEGRVPFLDFNLLRYLFGLRSDAIIKNGWNKYILREATKDLLPHSINTRRNKIGFTTPEHEWFMRMKNKIYTIFLSDSFAKRKYFNQSEVLKAFQNFIEGKNNDTMIFWRLLNLELWLREFVDEEKDVEFNQKEKKREIKVDGKTYLRFPIRTELFKKGDQYENIITQNVFNSKTIKQLSNGKWFIVVSEKIIAIAQGRSYFIWDIKPSFLANLLSRFVKKTPYGIGLGSPWTMELAIREIGVVKIVGAAVVAAATKPFGFRGVFYRIAGDTVRSIDGPTEYSLYPSNVSAKLGPREPQKAAQKIHDAIISKFQFQNSKQISNFLGVVIIDANDLGQNVLGNTTGLPNNLVERIFADNPMGQSDEQTPITIVYKS